MLNPKFFLLLTFIVCRPVFGQRLNEDSLIVQTQQLSGKEQVRSYLNLGELYLNKYGNLDSFYTCADKALHLAEKLRWEEGKIRSLAAVSFYYSRRNEIDKSNQILTPLIESHSEDLPVSLKGDLHYARGFNYFLANEYALAMADYDLALRLYESTNDVAGQALTHCRIAAIFSSEQQMDQCVQSIHRALRLAPAIEDSFKLTSVWSTASGQFVQIATTNLGYADSSIYYGQKALLLAIRDEYFTKGSQLCNSISAAYNLKGDHNQALVYLQTAARFAPYLYPSEGIITYFNLCDSYFNLGNYAMALAYLDSIDLVLTHFEDPYYTMIAAERVYAYNKEAGNLNEALVGLERLKMLEDSLFTLDKNRNINEIHARYQTELKDAEIKTLNQKQELDDLKITVLALLVGLILLTLFLVIFLFRLRLAKQKRLANEAEQRLNRARMNPHFFFNVLTSIQALALNPGQLDQVAIYIARLSKLMRQSLESTFQDEITLEEELDFLTQYLDVQKFYLDKKFDYQIILDKTVDSRSTLIPSMILQPFVENAIEHGFRLLKSGGMLKVHIVRNADQLQIEIDDNGDRSESTTVSKNYPSRATQIIKDRLFLLNQKKRSLASYELKAKPENAGTVALIRLPLTQF